MISPGSCRSSSPVASSSLPRSTGGSRSHTLVSMVAAGDAGTHCHQAGPAFLSAGDAHARPRRTCSSRIQCCRTQPGSQHLADLGLVLGAGTQGCAETQVVTGPFLFQPARLAHHRPFLTVGPGARGSRIKSARLRHVLVVLDAVPAQMPAPPSRAHRRHPQTELLVTCGAVHSPQVDGPTRIRFVRSKSVRPEFGGCLLVGHSASARWHRCYPFR